MIWFIIKGLIFTLALLAVSIKDARSFVIPRKYLLPCIAAGFINLQLFSSLAGAALMFLLILPFAMYGKIGGGDMWLLTACGWVLGLQFVLLGTLAGILAFFLWWLLFCRRNHRPFPLGPFFSIGCAAIYWLLA